MTEAAAGAPAQKTGISLSEWRVIILSSLGGALEFYDFVIYSMFAAYIGAAFFPNDNALVSLMVSFGVFGAGYLARPIGGIVLGHFGDKFGRRKVFIFSILLMSAATVGMGLLPTYAQIGIAAPALMILFRLTQGFCLGGELPGAITYVVETAPRRGGFAAGVIFFCVNSGVALASLLALGVETMLEPAQVESWGWRIGFLVGGALGLISFWLRLSLEETKEFMRTAKENKPALPSADIAKTRPLAIIVGILAIAATGGFNGYLFAMPGFLPTVTDHSSLSVIQGQNVCLAILSFGLLFMAWVGDRVPRRYILGVGAALLALLGVPFFAAAASGTVSIILLFALAGIVASTFNGVFSGIVADIYPTRVRFSGIGMSMNLAFTIFSGLGPLAATALVAATGSAASAGYFMVLSGVCGVLAALALKRFDGQIKAGLEENENDPEAQRTRAPWGDLARATGAPAPAAQTAPAE